MLIDHQSSKDWTVTLKNSILGENNILGTIVMSFLYWVLFSLIRKLFRNISEEHSWSAVHQKNINSTKQYSVLFQHFRKIRIFKSYSRLVQFWKAPLESATQRKSFYFDARISGPPVRRWSGSFRNILNRIFRSVPRSSIWCCPWYKNSVQSYLARSDINRSDPILIDPVRGSWFFGSISFGPKSQTRGLRSTVSIRTGTVIRSGSSIHVLMESLKIIPTCARSK